LVGERGEGRGGRERERGGVGEREPSASLFSQEFLGDYIRV
jgi:hypothetical protein